MPEDSLLPKKTPWYYSVMSVIVGLVLLGPLAFPLLWKSSAFNFTWKVVLTLAFTVATIYMIWGTWYMVALILQEFRNAGVMR